MSGAKMKLLDQSKKLFYAQSTKFETVSYQCDKKRWMKKFGNELKTNLDIIPTYLGLLIASKLAKQGCKLRIFLSNVCFSFLKFIMSQT